MAKEKVAQVEYIDLQKAAFSFLRKKAKADWMKDGDSNSRFFHSVIKGRRTRNQVYAIKDDDGKEHMEPQGIQEVFLQYYTKLLGTEYNTHDVNEAIVGHGPVCTPAHITTLLRPVTTEEIKAAIFSMPDQKSPGPDGFTSAFYKASWSIIGNDVVEAIMDVFNSGKVLKQLNTTILTLIPKVKRPHFVSQYRPIACCNVMYKCVSKLICSRLALVLPELVSRNQGGFIKGRSIMENILICQDLVRLYNRKACSPRCLFKIDLMKAYDTVSWRFIDQMLTAYNFPAAFRRLIMECISSASFSLSLNGEVFGFFRGKRGLRQGDPMSPLIFTLCMEYLSRILDCATAKLKFSYHPLCKSLKLTHLMFADDLLLFSKGDPASVMVLLRSFSAFSAASGLQGSPLKSNAYFNGMSGSLKQEILSVSGYVEGRLPFKYLGVPITAGRMKSKDCAILIDKIVERIRCIGARKLSYAGRLVLVQSVLTSLHSYWASMFVLPKGVLKRVEAICRNFLWDGQSEYRRPAPVAWSTVCSPKKEGGLNIRDGYKWNCALVGKLVWWMVVKADRLWVQWMHHVHIKRGSWSQFVPQLDTSWYVRRICSVRDKLRGFLLDDDMVDPSTEFSVKSCYKWLSGQDEMVGWYKSVWHPDVVPKHSMIAWMISHKALLLKDRLFKYGVAMDDLCCFCDLATETHRHLFVQCQYTRRVLGLISVWLRVSLEEDDLLGRIAHHRWPRIKKSVANASVIGCWYIVWMQRSEARMNQMVYRPECVMIQLKTWIRGRVLMKRDCYTLHERDWLDSVCL